MAYKSFKFHLIYVFSINDTAHRGCLKVGETTLSEEVENPFALEQNSTALNMSAHKRIQQYTSTAGVAYTLHHTELTACLTKGKIVEFNDKQVHQVLQRSGIKKHYFDNGKRANEWFECSLAEVKAAIKAAKEGRTSINRADMAHKQEPIVFRPEQEYAIRQTVKRFKTNNQFLWNAKMRFGKTLSALQVVRKMEIDRTLILTHRPVVDDGWYEDFGKIFFDRNDYRYGSRTKGEQWDSLQRWHGQGKHYVYFASIQDLRGSEQVGGSYDKNAEIFSTDWDLLIVDEAHEGTKTALGQAVLNELFQGKTKMLQLSGTPFNLFDDYDEKDIFTWDYVKEQRAKEQWELTHWGDPNPYAGLPKLNIYTFDLSLELKKYQDEEHAFNFAEFFRVRQDGTFWHEEDVNRFLDLLASNEAKGYPYSTLAWRQVFRHTLWTVPTVAAAKALSEKIRGHKVLGMFRVVNVAGDGDSDADYESRDALAMVREAIGEHPEETYTITLTRGRLTTGVSVPAWTAVFMLHGSYATSAASYMQTIFRAQTPAKIGGKIKEECYVFDFAPDRTLKVLAETAKVSAKAGKTQENDRAILGEFLNFCPVISFHGAQMEAISVDHMMQQLKRAYVERVVRNGFEDSYLYNDKLLRLDHIEMEKFANLREIIGKTKAMKPTDEVDINKQGFTNEEYEEIERLKEKKKKTALTLEEQQRLKEAEEKKKVRNTAISILRGISIRMPMLLYGADIQDEEREITLSNFTTLVDDQSWAEFMPKGVSKELFMQFIPYYDEDVFAAAGLRIRKLAREADEMDIEERIERITTLFGSFRNPDKETVLTPWRVVNMQLADTLGGWCFYDEEYKERLSEPRWVDKGQVTAEVFGAHTKVLEINSKSGLYPLYVAYSIYRQALDKDRMQWMITDSATEDRKARHRKIWRQVVEKNLFIICKTPMAKSITRRTLVGFREANVHTRYFEDLINQITHKQQKFIEQITKPSYWKINEQNTMKFNAIVGNPPYQVNDGGGTGDSATPIYHNFFNISCLISSKYVSMIMPSRWMKGGKGLQEFRHKMINDHQLVVIYDFARSSDCFPNQTIDGGICYLLWEKGHSDKLKYVYTDLDGNTIQSMRYLDDNQGIVVRDERQIGIIEKCNSEKTFNILVSARKPYGFCADFFNIPERYPSVKYTTEQDADGVRIFGIKGKKGGARRTIAYISKDSVVKGVEELTQYKLFFSKAYMATATVPPEIIVAQPNDICTETFLRIGAFDTQEEQLNCLKYIHSKFFRALLFYNRHSLNVSSASFALIPLQDFTTNSDIDWSKSVAEIDQQLYTKYGLAETEIAFIESMIKPM